MTDKTDAELIVTPEAMDAAIARARIERSAAFHAVFKALIGRVVGLFEGAERKPQISGGAQAAT